MSDCQSCNGGHSHSHGHMEEHDEKKKIKQIIFGAVIFAAGIICSKFFSSIFAVPDLDIIIFTLAYLILGRDIVLLAVRNVFRGKFFDENFLMAIATIGAFLIGEYPEAVGVMLFYQVGEFFQDMAVSKSKKSITALMDIRPDFANLLKNGETIKVSPNSVRIGDLILVKPGEKIPLDGEVIEGESMIDTSALTGESVPRKAGSGDSVFAGCINQNGVLTIKAAKTAGQSAAAKIIDLAQNASAKKAPTEKFITKFSYYYTPVVVGLAVLIAVLPPLLGLGEWSEWIRRSLVFLVISCPCALVISIPLGFFGGIGGASRKGILVKGGNYLEALNHLDIVVFDKTGTLTKGIFDVSAIIPANNYTQEQVLEYAAKAESFSNHPIAISITKAYGKEVEKSALSNYNEISGLGISVVQADNAQNSITILAGNHKLMSSNGISFTEVQDIGTKVYVAAGNEFIGCIVISDALKPDSKAAIAALKGRSKTVMLSGDNPEIAGSIAAELGLDEYYAGLLPHEKVEKLEMLLTQKKKKGSLAFVGDGINDAPVLARADIGIAMGGLGSDAAIEAADVVLMTDEPSKLLEAVGIARFTKRIVWQNIILALGIKSIFLVLGALGAASLWEAVFADVGVALIAILNASRVMRQK